MKRNMFIGSLIGCMVLGLCSCNQSSNGEDSPTPSALNSGQVLSATDLMPCDSI